MTLTEEINYLYNRWLTAIDPTDSQQALNMLYAKLKKFTFAVIFRDYNSQFSHAEEIFQNMMLKVLIKSSENKICTLDYFLSWYRVALKNYILDFIKMQNRKKRDIISYEADLPFDLETAGETASIEDYNTNTRLEEARELLKMLQKAPIEYELFLERHIDGAPETELALQYGTTVDGIKGRLKRIKKKIILQFEEFKKN